MGDGGKERERKGRAEETIGRERREGNCARLDRQNSRQQVFGIWKVKFQVQTNLLSP
jgi:hypothetical protein